MHRKSYRDHDPDPLEGLSGSFRHGILAASGEVDVVAD